jgi:molybdenum cofactor synthesis domain-containing protein
MPAAYRAAVVTVSDSVAQGTRQDLSGPAVARILEAEGWTVRSKEVLPDDFSLLRERLAALASDVDVDAVFTTGGTGVGPRDRTPEATTSVMERSLPGLAELMRRDGMQKTPLAALSRAVVGVKGKTLLVNLPGAPQGAEDSLRAVLPLLSHAVGVIRGEAVHGEPVQAAAAAEPAPVAEAPAAPDDAAPQEGLGKEEPL